MAHFEDLSRIIESGVRAAGFELYGFEQLGGAQIPLLRVYIDKPGGVSIDDCAQASRQLGTVLDVASAFSGRYTLEVSSPGMDRPLFLPEHYTSQLGKQVKLKLEAPLDGQSNFNGRIAAVNGEDFVLETESGRLILPFSAIKSAKLIPEF